jgi:hypothetical protein
MRVLPTTLILAPDTKFVPEIRTARLVSTPYVTDGGFNSAIVGCGATTVNPPGDASVSPLGFVTRTSYVPGANVVLSHQNRSVVLLLYT